MSPTSDDGAHTSLRPFQCSTCSRRFTRLENLKRHLKLHEGQAQPAIACPECSATFARNDLRRRHMKRKHGEVDGDEDGGDDEPLRSPTEDAEMPDVLPVTGGASANMGDPPDTAPLADLPVPTDAILADLGDPIIDRSLPGGDSGVTPGSLPLNSIGWSPASFDALINSMGDAADPDPRRPLQPPAPSEASASAYSNTALLSRAAGLLVSHTAGYFDFIHLPTLNASSVPPILAQAILSVGLLFSDRHNEAAMASTHYLAGKQLAAEEFCPNTMSSTTVLATAQALCLLSACAVLCMCGDETSIGIKLHGKCIELARKRGLMEPHHSSTAESGSLKNLWLAAVQAEAHKRTLFCIYNLDALYYCLLSKPRSVSHLEIKHDLVQSNDIWAMQTEAEWAHRMLVGSMNRPKIRYIDAVRQSFNCSAEYMSSLGTPSVQLVLMFHYTSLREVSGWSTMTGRASLDRFEALHASLTAMESACTFGDHAHDPVELLCEWTWHICMLELCLWSQPHTGGLVEDSLDGALAAGAMLARTSPVTVPPDIVATLEPHLSWMLLRADRMPLNDSVQEAPWTLVYAFKALLITWQIVGMRTGQLDPTLQALGVDTTAMDAGQAGLAAWFRRVMDRKQIWGLGRAIDRGLRVLEDT